MTTSKIIFNIGQTIAAFSAGSGHANLSQEWRRLKKGVQLTLVSVPVLVSLYALILLIFMTFNYPGSAILVYARSEYVEYVPMQLDPPQWVLPPAILTLSTSRETHQIDEGILETSCGDRLTISRIGNGNLKLHVLPAAGGETAVAQRKLIEDEEFPDETYFEKEYLEPESGLESGFSLEFRNIHEKVKNGESLNWPMTGLIVPGRPIKYETSRSRGLLLDGTVQVLTRYLWEGNHYEERKIDLNIGDQIVLETTQKYNGKIAKSIDPGSHEAIRSDMCKKATQTDKGFINLDASPGVNVVMSSESDSGEIVRYNTTPIHLGSSWIQRLALDKWFALSWAFIVVFFTNYRRIVRAILAHDKYKVD